MKAGAVIVAAGMSTRMKQFKQLMKVGNFTFAERVVTSFRNAGVRRIVMVTGYRAEELEQSLAGQDIIFVRNEEYATTQMFDSAKIGLRKIGNICEKVFFCPVDIPFFLEDTVRLELTRTEQLVFPICHNRIGHPVMFDSSLIPKILAYEGERGMKGALDSISGQTTCYLPVKDEGAVMDADTKQDLQYLLDIQNARMLRPQVTVTLAGSRGFFGPQTYELLKGIDALGSVSEACKRIDVSYSKGWKILQEAEKGLGYRIVERQAGGRNGGASQLTDRCHQLMTLYDRLVRQVRDDAEQSFCDLFSASELFSRSTRERKKA